MWCHIFYINVHCISLSTFNCDRSHSTGKLDSVYSHYKDDTSTLLQFMHLQKLTKKQVCPVKPFLNKWCLLWLKMKHHTCQFVIFKWRSHSVLWKQNKLDKFLNSWSIENICFRALSHREPQRTPFQLWSQKREKVIQIHSNNVMHCYFTLISLDL